MATGYGMDSRFDSRHEQEILILPTASRPVLHPHSSIQWALWVLSPVVKRPRLEADHLPPSNAKVKNGGAIHPLSYTFSWHTDKFTFIQSVPGGMCQTSGGCSLC
jgi:hypothetical protein